MPREIHPRARDIKLASLPISATVYMNVASASLSFHLDGERVNGTLNVKIMSGASAASGALVSSIPF